MARLLLAWSCLFLHYGSALAADKPSRAAWWLAQDDVKPIADLINSAEPGKSVRFNDRVGKFQVKGDDRALVITGDFPEANVSRFDLTTFEGQFDMRKLYLPNSASCA